MVQADVGFLLQFGHGGDAVGDFGLVRASTALIGRFNSATAVTPWVTPSTLSLLTQIFGFNSATAVTPWVTRLHARPCPGGPRLQFGHGGDAVGDNRYRERAWEGRSASIRPRR